MQSSKSDLKRHVVCCCKVATKGNHLRPNGAMARALTRLPSLHFTVVA